MTAKEFVLKKLNECLLFVHDDYPESIFHVWDKQLLRQKKLQRLSNINTPINFKISQNSIILFEQDYKNEKFWYDYDNIIQFLKDKYSLNDNSINNLMNDILNDDNKMKSLTPFTAQLNETTILNDGNKMKSLTPEENYYRFIFLNDGNKMKSLTPHFKISCNDSILNDGNKMKSLTPFQAFLVHSIFLKDDNKMKSLTPEGIFTFRQLPLLEDDNKMKSLAHVGGVAFGTILLEDDNKMKSLNTKL